MTKPSSSVRPSRGGATRVAIERAAIRLFATRSPDSVSIDDIVREAAVAKGSFYNHFDDKSGLVGNLMNEVRASVEPVVAQLNQGFDDPAVRLGRALSVYVRFAIDHPERALVLTLADDGQLSASAGLNQGLVKDLRSGLASARFAFATVESAVLFVSGITRLLVLSVARQGQLSITASHAQQMTTMMLRGLGVEWRDAERIAAWSVEDIVNSRRDCKQEITQ